MNPENSQSEETGKPSQSSGNWRYAVSVGLGISIGTAIGVGIDQLAVCLAVGITFGIVFGFNGGG